MRLIICHNSVLGFLVGGVLLVPSLVFFVFFVPVLALGLDEVWLPVPFLALDFLWGAVLGYSLVLVVESVCLSLSLDSPQLCGASEWKTKSGGIYFLSSGPPLFGLLVSPFASS